MEGLDLSALFGPQPVFFTVDQLRGILALAESTENAVAVMALNDGGTSVTARVVTGERPIPSESKVDDETETVFGVTGTAYHVGRPESSEDYETALHNALEAAYEDGKELVQAEESARAREAILS